MSNGTPYDKYCRGWHDEGDPPYPRSMRNEFAIHDSLESNRDLWEETRPSCWCSGWEEMCTCPFYIPPPEKRRKKPDHSIPLERYERPKGRTPFSPNACGGDPHVWETRERWVGKYWEPLQFQHHNGRMSRPRWYTKPLPKKELRRYLVCRTCRLTLDHDVVHEWGTRVWVWRGRQHRRVRMVPVERALNPSETVEYEKVLAAWEEQEKRDNKATSPLRDTQAPRKRTARKRDPDDSH